MRVVLRVRFGLAALRPTCGERESPRAFGSAERRPRPPEFSGMLPDHLPWGGYAAPIPDSNADEQKDEVREQEMIGVSRRASAYY
jgi:hypothetical protein